MKPVYETCKPREEVLEGALVEDIFAAELTPVMTGAAPKVYADAGTFFANTFPTEGLCALAREVFKRLSGKGGKPDALAPAPQAAPRSPAGAGQSRSVRPAAPAEAARVMRCRVPPPAAMLTVGVGFQY